MYYSAQIKADFHRYVRARTTRGATFAAITDEPPPEIAATGGDALQAILEDRDRPYYEHRLAA